MSRLITVRKLSSPFIILCKIEGAEQVNRTCLEHNPLFQWLIQSSSCANQHAFSLLSLLFEATN